MAIKKVDPSKQFEIIAEADDALISETEQEEKDLKAEKKQTRYEQYLEDLDESKLKFAEGKKPSKFIIRCLLNTEQAEINNKYLKFDPVTKKVNSTNSQAMMIEIFDTACIGMRDENGVVAKVTSNELGYGVALNIATVISNFTTLGKHLKNA